MLENYEFTKFTLVFEETSEYFCNERGFFLFFDTSQNPDLNNPSAKRPSWYTSETGSISPCLSPVY
jgi:hypothetical protein